MGKKNYEVAEILNKIADYEDLGDQEYKVRAYRRAARSIENLSEDIESIFQKGELDDIPGVGPAIARKIEEFLKTGKLEKLERMKKESPVDVETLNSIESMGPKKIKILYRELGVKDINDLERVAKQGKIRDLSGFGEVSEKRILDSIELAKVAKERMPRRQAVPIAEKIMERLKGIDNVESVEVVGSYRRMRETIGDLDILIVSSSPEKVMDFFVSMDEVDRILGKGKTKSSIVLKNGLQVDLRIVSSESYGAALIYFTGPKFHNIYLRKIAIKKGYKLNEYGLYKGKEMIAGVSEEQVYQKLDLPYIKPEERDNYT